MNMNKKYAIHLSNEHLETAFLFAEMAKNTESVSSEDKFFNRVRHHSLVTSSIIASSCALEAYINEWFTKYSYNTKSTEIHDQLIKSLWGVGIPRTAAYPILRKYQVALMLTSNEPFEESSEPYQSANLLIKLRNALVHYEPSLEPVEHPDYAGNNKPHQLTKQLRGLFELHPHVADWAPLWPTKILSAGCANWAANASNELMTAFIEKTGTKSGTIKNEEKIRKIKEFAMHKDWQQIL